LIEVPVLVGLVYVALFLRRRVRWASGPQIAARPQTGMSSSYTKELT